MTIISNICITEINKIKIIYIQKIYLKSKKIKEKSITTRNLDINLDQLKEQHKVLRHYSNISTEKKIDKNENR